MKSLISQLKNNENPIIIDEGVITLEEHEKHLKEVLKPYFDKPKEDILWGSEKLHEAINKNIQQFVTTKDSNKPRGSNFTPKKKKRK